MDTSIHWYRNILGFELIDRVESHERGFKISNLQRGENMIELIQLDSAIDPKNVVPEFNSKIRILGIFKTGYQVSDFDEWIIHLKEKKVEFYGNIVTDTNTNKRTVILTDPDGNRFQLFEK
jgi:catechol 2,3-dioxygenase-like lactoylglutathione lyase family enzyme